MPLSEDMLARLRLQLTFCPTCGWRLDNHESKHDVRVCVNHGEIFLIRSEGDTVWVEMQL